MKRFFTAALVTGLFCSMGLVGCSEKAETQQKETVTTPGGTTETTKTETIKSSGETPPPNSAGQTVEPPK
jgi:hypothetical protein